MITFNSRLFLHDKIANTFFAEASTLQASTEHDKLFEPVDAIHIGFVMESQRTGKKATYQVECEVRDADNDLVEWIMHPTAATMQQFPQLVGSRIMIAND